MMFPYAPLNLRPVGAELCSLRGRAAAIAAGRLRFCAACVWYLQRHIHKALSNT